MARALDSVLKQTFQDFEIIVVDDGSTDNGAALVAQNPDKRIRLLSQANAGPGAARNRGMAESRSPYVAFLDADDEWLPVFLEKSRANLKQHPECAASFCRNLQGANKQPWTLPPGTSLPEGVWRLTGDCSTQQLFSIISSAIPSAMGVREKILALGGYYENRCLFGEDIFLWLLVCLNHPIYLEREAWVVYHTEDSDLNWYHQEKTQISERIAKRPLNAWLLASEKIREKCPAEHRNFLERFLAYDALGEANTRASHGDLKTARLLASQYQLMNSFGWNYTKLRIKLLFPRVGALMRSLKHS